MTTYTGGAIRPVKDITGATTLTAGDAGAVCFLNAAAGAVVTLPAPVAGMEFTFVTALAFATTSWDITAATADTMEGQVTVAGAAVSIDAADSVDFVESAENLGDYIHVISDGTKWFVSGQGLTTGSIVSTG